MDPGSASDAVVPVDTVLEPVNEATAQDELKCMACGAARSGPFCSRCGQREFVGRHTLRGFLSSALRRTVGEEGARNTVWQLALHPGHVVHDYLAGRTVRYVHPAAYLLLTAALFTVVGRMLVGSTGAAESDRIIVLLVVPFVAAASRLLFWRGPYNYAEHLIAVTYLGAHSVLILTLLFPGTLIVPQHLLSAYSLACLGVAVGYFVWAYSRIFDKRPWLAAAAGIVALGVGTIAWLAVTVAALRLIRA